MKYNGNQKKQLIFFWFCIIIIHAVIMCPWLNWIEHSATDRGIRGSSPLGHATKREAKHVLLFFAIKNL